MPTAPRALTTQERAILERMAQYLPETFKPQVPGLKVVGRCGCGNCPTIFFLPHAEGEQAHDLLSLAGRDSEGGLVAAVLMEKAGQLSQLDFWSVDGHEPWQVPEPGSLALF